MFNGYCYFMSQQVRERERELFRNVNCVMCLILLSVKENVVSTVCV